MSPRPYRLGRRAEVIDATRQAIVDAARTLLIDGGHRRLTLEGVAERANVARATVYYQFGSKGGLLEAVAADAERRAGIDRFEGLAAKTGEAALRMLCGEHARFWAAEEAVFRVFIGLAGIDPDIRTVVRRHDASRRHNLRQLVQRIRADGALGARWTVPLAADALWFVTSFEAFDHLHSRSGLSVERTGLLLETMASVILERRR